MYILGCIYIRLGRIERRRPMNTAKIFKSGNSQAVRLPKGFQLEGTEVYVKKVGRGLLMMPTDDPWASLLGSLDNFSEDFMGERVQPQLESRETL
jgi:antitoxin VapB